MVTNAPTRRRTDVVVPCETIRQLINDDLGRECRSIFAYAVYVERLLGAGRTAEATATERRGRHQVRHALIVCQVLYDFNGMVTAPVDELNAVLNADRVAGRNWEADTIRRLRERARQLRAVGEPGLARRLARLAAAKATAPTLAALLERPIGRRGAAV